MKYKSLLQLLLSEWELISPMFGLSFIIHYQNPYKIIIKKVEEQVVMVKMQNVLFSTGKETRLQLCH